MHRCPPTSVQVPSGCFCKCAKLCIPCLPLYVADILPWSRAVFLGRRKRSLAPNDESVQTHTVEASPLTLRWTLGANGNRTLSEATHSCPGPLRRSLPRDQ